MDENGGEDFVNFFGLLRKHELYLQLQSTLETLSSSSSWLSIRMCKVWILLTKVLVLKEFINWPSSHYFVLSEVLIQWYQLGAKYYSKLSNVMLLFDITERKNLVEEGQMMRSYNTNALHTTYSWNIKWQKCAGIGLNGFISKKNKLIWKY